jgi:hypothetical protein
LAEEYSIAANNENNNRGEYPIIFDDPVYDHLLGDKSLGWKSGSDMNNMGLVYNIDDKGYRLEYL